LTKNKHAANYSESQKQRYEMIAQTGVRLKTSEIRAIPYCFGCDLKVFEASRGADRAAYHFPSNVENNKILRVMKSNLEGASNMIHYDAIVSADQNLEEGFPIFDWNAYKSKAKPKQDP
jgi:hypothetical protein